MGYLVRGFVGDSNIDLIAKKYSYAKRIPLNKGNYFIPMIDDLFDEINNFNNSPAINHFVLMNENIKNIILKDIKQDKVIYFEADYFGGKGTQSSIAFINGKVIYLNDSSDNNINNALKLLGVKRDINSDEFKIVGLDKYRDTLDWYEVSV